MKFASGRRSRYVWRLRPRRWSARCWSAECCRICCGRAQTRRHTMPRIDVTSRASRKRIRWPKRPWWCGEWTQRQRSGCPGWTRSLSTASKPTRDRLAVGFAWDRDTWAGWRRVYVCWYRTANSARSSLGGSEQRSRPAKSQCLWRFARPSKVELPSFISPRKMQRGRIRLELYKSSLRFNFQWNRTSASLFYAFDSRPQVLDTGSGLGRDGQDLVELQALLQSGQVAGAFVAAEAVNLGSHHGEIAPGMPQPVDELAVALLRRNVGVHEANTKPEGFTFGEIRFYEGGPACRDRLGDLRVAVAGQIGKGQFWPLARIEQGEKVDSACAAGGGGDFGGLFARQCVEQA